MRLKRLLSKKVNYYLICILILLIFTGCHTESYNYLPDIHSIDVDMSVYEGFHEVNHVYEKISFKESLRFFSEKASGIVYYGYPECPHCTQVVPILNKAAAKYDKAVYYVDVHETITSEDYDAFVAFAEEFLKKDEEGEPVFYVPLVFVYVNGEIKGSHLGVTESFDPALGITEGQKNELQKALEEMIKILK